MKESEKPPRYLFDGRHNPAFEQRGLPKYLPLTLPPLRKHPIRVHPRQVTLPPMDQFMQMTFASRYYTDPNHPPPTSFLQPEQGQSSADHTVPHNFQETGNVHQPRPPAPAFHSNHKIWNLLRLTNYYLPDDLHYAIVTGQHAQTISDLIVRLEADYRQRITRPSSCLELPRLCTDPSHPIWNLLLLTDYDLPDEVRDAINEFRPLVQIKEICERLLKIWKEKQRV